MSVRTINVGPKRVAVTAYCPDDTLGLLACELVLDRLEKLFEKPLTMETFKKCLIELDPEHAELFRMLDEGYVLPKASRFPVSPGNVREELRCIRHLVREQMEQRTGT